MYSHVFSVLFLVNLMIINSSLKSQNYVVDDRNAFKSYDKMYISKRIEAYNNGDFASIEREEYNEFINVNIMVNKGDKVRLPCFTIDSLDSFYSETVIVDIKKLTGEWSVECQYNDMRTCNIEGDSNEYNYIDDDDIVTIETEKMGEYECTLSGTRECTINGSSSLCRNYNLHIRITIKDIMDQPPPRTTVGPGTIYKQNGTSIYRSKRASPNQEDLLGTCIIDAMKNTKCSKDGISIDFPNEEEGNEAIEFTVTEDEDSTVGSYTCETKISDLDTREAMCSEKFKYQGVETINMWHCKNLVSTHHEMIYRNMEELKINKISTANENKTGAIEHKFLIWTSNKDDQVECVVKIGKKTWNEYSEIAAAETSNNAYLRCCVNIKGCNEVELWDKDQLTGFNWIVYPISSWTGDLQEAVKLMRLRAKNPGSGTLFGLCGRERRPANYNIILINAIASLSLW